MFFHLGMKFLFVLGGLTLAYSYFQICIDQLIRG